MHIAIALKYISLSHLYVAIKLANSRAAHLQPDVVFVWRQTILWDFLWMGGAVGSGSQLKGKS